MVTARNDAISFGRAIGTRFARSAGMHVPAFLREISKTYDRRVQAAGRALLRRRRVQLEQLQPWLVKARVRASDADLAVFVALGASRVLAASCPCDLFRETHACAHAWSALLAVEERRALSRGLERLPEAGEDVEGGGGEDVVASVGAEDTVPAEDGAPVLDQQ